MEEHKVVLNCFNKTFTYTDNNGDNIKLRGNTRKVSEREISMLQMKRLVIKGCTLFIVYIMNDKENDNKLKIKDILVLKEFEDIF